MSEGRIQLDFGTLNPIQRHVSEEFRKGKRFVAMITGRQGGKLLSLDTRVPTPSGWSTMGELAPGDTVFGEDGAPTKVLWVSDIETNPTAYKITFDDGHEVLADANHEWLSYTKKARKAIVETWRKPHGPEVVTTEHMRETLYAHGHKDAINPRTGRRREANHAIPLTAPVEFPEKDLPIDPYVFGVWLGDGSSGSGAVTFGDEELIDLVRSKGYHVPDGEKDKDRNAWTRTIHGILPTLRDIGALRNKHIPEAFMLGSVPQREELLRGLMDTDGYCTEKGTAEFYSSNESLAAQVRSLVESLGYKARLKVKEAKINGVSYGDTYRVVFTPDRPVFHLPRKLSRQKFDGRLERKFRYVHSIEPVPPVPMRCIAVDNDSHLYLVTDAFIPTHNSHYGARWLISQIATGKGKNKLSIVAAPTFRYARIAQRKLEEVFKSDPRLWKAIKQTKQPIPTYELPDGHIIEVHSVDNPDSVRGLTVDFVWFDEAAVAAGDAFDIMIPTLLASGGSMLLTTTPRGRSNWIYKKIYLKSIPPGEDGHDDALYSPYYATVFGSTWENVDNLTHEAVKLMEEQYGKGSRFAAQEIEGTFVTYDGLVFQWDEDINFLTPGEMPDLKEFDHIIGGLDFGWTDPNAAVVLGYKDGLWYALDGQYETHQSMDDLANQLSVFGERYGVKVWYADSARPDSIAELQSRGIPVVAVKKPTLEDSIRMMSTFVNRNRFKVSHRVPWLKDEFQTYQYVEVGRKGQQTPLDKSNHLVDASRYALHMYRWLWANKFDYTTPSEGEDMSDRYTPWGELKRDWRRGRNHVGNSPSGLWGN